MNIHKNINKNYKNIKKKQTEIKKYKNQRRHEKRAGELVKK